MIEESEKMLKYEYRLKSSLIIEQVWSQHSGAPSTFVPCHKCGGRAFLISSIYSAEDDSEAASKESVCATEV